VPQQRDGVHPETSSDATVCIDVVARSPG
jgi:hypothetical protein